MDILQIIRKNMATEPMTQDEKETALAAFLQEEIWKEITAEQGITRADLDNKLITAIKEIASTLK